MKHAARFGNGAYLAEDLEKAAPGASTDTWDFASLPRACERRTRSKYSAVRYWSDREFTNNRKVAAFDERG